MLNRLCIRFIRLRNFLFLKLGDQLKVAKNHTIYKK